MELDLDVAAVWAQDLGAAWAESLVAELRTARAERDALAARIEAARIEAQAAVDNFVAGRRGRVNESGYYSAQVVLCVLSAATEPADPEPEYPHESGDFIVLGPEAFADKNRTVICWRGENYRRVADPETTP